MKYLIRLENRRNGNVATIVCPADITLEELSVKIKLELSLPYTDYGSHSFGFMGKVYIPDNCNLNKYFDNHSEYQPSFRDNRLPSPRDLRYTERFTLDRVYTVKGSALTYFQNSCNGWEHISCTLVDRML